MGQKAREAVLTFEREAKSKNAVYICGCDEAGRGCLAGPVVAASVHIRDNQETALVGVNDSKILTKKKRESLFETILAHCDVSFSVISPEKIDEVNIYEASRLAMLESLKNHPDVDYVLTDAMPLPSLQIPVEPIIKGDQKSLSIAASSIIAKCIRDRIMEIYDELYPQYGFKQHKGYPTKQHKMALEKYGIIDGLYRETYKPVQAIRVSQDKLF